MKWKTKMGPLTLVLLSCVLFIPQSEQYSSGAPEPACDTMLPKHGQPPIAPQTSVSPYILTPSASQVKQGTGVNVTMSSPLGVPIRGFFLQARSVQDRRQKLGTWSNLPPLTQLKTCGSTDNSVTHTNTNEKSNLVFQWNAPSNFLGSVIFRATVAEKYDQFWAETDSSLVEVVTPGTTILTSPVITTTEITIQTKTTSLPTTSPTERPKPIFYEGCNENKLCFGNSDGCIEQANCIAAASVKVKGDRYEFELLARRSPAYIALGLSNDRNMGNDSSMECVQNNGRVSVFNSWTYFKADPYVSRQNVPQDILKMESSEYVNGDIYCRFTRDAHSVVRGVVFDLTKDKYHLLLVSGSEAHPEAVGFHDKLFISSESKLSLSEVGSVKGASRLLLKLHGAFMLAAWIGTASCGILLARYYRQTWVGKQLGGKDLWFAWHRIFMICTWLLTIASFIIILIEVGGWTTTGDNPHAIIGTVTVFLCFIQPIGAYFRPHPNTPKRPIFNWLHWLIGNSAQIVGIVTIFFAVYLNKAQLPDYTTYILVAFVIFHVVMHIILSIGGCVSDGRISNGRVNSFPMKDLMTNNRQAANQDRQMDAPHSSFRKSLLGVYIVIIALFAIALICLVCLNSVSQDTRM